MRSDFVLVTDSRKVKKGDTFLALRGVETDGHDYIVSAIENGASKVICEHGSYDVETVVVEDTRKYLADYLHNMYDNELADIKFVGITGTNGKTTTAYLVYQMLNKLSCPTAYIGTIGFYMVNSYKETQNTTPDLMELYEMFDLCIKNKIEVIVMEVSSHALEIGRLMGIDFDIVAFTNLTQDHLDVHGTFENYMKAKQKLFYKVKKGGKAIVNIDDEYASNFLIKGNNNITYGFNKGDYHVISSKLLMNKTVFDFNYKDVIYNAEVNLLGKYNIYNYLLALIIVNGLGYDIKEILGIKVSSPPGRFEIINYQDNVIIVDYAHTPDAMENILKCCNELKRGNIITVIGCGGKRDKTKRPIMGDIATKYSSYVIFTDDNPRCEDSKEITNDIIRNLGVKNFEVNNDRYEATKKAISLLNHNDMLLILGKGHENYQIIGNEKIHYSDKETVLEIIKNSN